MSPTAILQNRITGNLIPKCSFLFRCCCQFAQRNFFSFFLSLLLKIQDFSYIFMFGDIKGKIFQPFSCSILCHSVWRAQCNEIIRTVGIQFAEICSNLVLSLSLLDILWKLKLKIIPDRFAFMAVLIEFTETIRYMIFQQSKRLQKIKQHNSARHEIQYLDSN